MKPEREAMLHPAEALLCHELHHHRRIPVADNRVYVRKRAGRRKHCATLHAQKGPIPASLERLTHKIFALAHAIKICNIQKIDASAACRVAIACWSLCGFFIAICITPQPSLETLGPFLPNIVVCMVFPLSR